VGEKDYIAIVVSVQKLDYNRLNDAFNSAQGTTYSEKVYNTLKGELAKDVRFEGGKTIRFSTDITYKGTVAMVLEILK
jgi:hypothetical protein